VDLEALGPLTLVTAMLDFLHFNVPERLKALFRGFSGFGWHLLNTEIVNDNFA
jgi:hypothetical protein